MVKVVFVVEVWGSLLWLAMVLLFLGHSGFVALFLSRLAVIK